MAEVPDVPDRYDPTRRLPNPKHHPDLTERELRMLGWFYMCQYTTDPTEPGGIWYRQQDFRDQRAAVMKAERRRRNEGA
jgi:hypothetical protein